MRSAHKNLEFKMAAQKPEITLGMYHDCCKLSTAVSKFLISVNPTELFRNEIMTDEYGYSCWEQITAVYYFVRFFNSKFLWKKTIQIEYKNNS